ncbi:pyruvate,water dikinase [Desulfosalsimonas propionicica]|uniref:Phosphoenolpyruvate synthase n=1 Tax=Desulfosalsimonas propionicica TaxID=332175 RepID=A0A7W0C7G6_9BACT|nr:PEP/pyruvate-binding domain-containing protein [Desulfosalsimonas propionicica]MBA2880586.1 pyruvate,water dikinase [Desulfosalsimonas propionicica]
MAQKIQETASGPIPLTRVQRIGSQTRHLLENWFLRTCFPGSLIRKKYAAFQHLRAGDRRALELISQLEEIRQKNSACDIEYIRHLLGLLDYEIQVLIEALVRFNPVKYALLRNYHRKYAFYAHMALAEDDPKTDPPYVLGLDQELSESLAGGKAAPLSRLIRDFDIPVPAGMVMTTRAFYRLLAANDLTAWVQRQLARIGPNNHSEINEISQALQFAVTEAQMPPELENEFLSGINRLGIENEPLALRSSAVGEDLQASFAGQFKTCLNVGPENWFEAYKQVAASKYSPHAIHYRMRQGFTDQMTPMAVLIMPTIAAKISGILYTRDPHRPELAVSYMVTGSGENLADGGQYQGRADFDRQSRRVGKVAPRDFLGPDILENLFGLGMKLEHAAGRVPQDVEWLLDTSGKLRILQSRPLGMPVADTPDSQPDYPESAVLITGQWVSSGQTAGRVYKLNDLKFLSDIPDQAVLVTDDLPPELTLVLNRVRAVVAEKGSPACHFASVAREAGIPVICNARGAADTLENQQDVSIDGNTGKILAGTFFRAKPGKTASAAPQTPVIQKLADALRYVSPLTLPDSESPDFTIGSCRSLHDIVRYVHEAGVREMFSLVGRRGLDRYGAKRLESGLPLVMHVLDVYKGLSPEAAGQKSVALKHIESLPMRQLFDGLGSPAVQWNSGILHYDWDAYYKSSADFVDVEKSTLFSSYAIVDREYLHALLRFGYHFAVLDSVQGTVPEQNYIHFSFKGGGGSPDQRDMRIYLIQTILEHFGFVVHTTSDLLEAALDRKSMDDTGTGLVVLGIVLGKTVMLDMRLEDQQQIQTLARQIIQETHDIFSVQEKR